MPPTDPSRPAAAARAVRRDRRQAVLSAAEKLFAQRGYHAVTIRQIAREAAVPAALVGYHFGHKQELFHAIFAHHQRLHAECIEAIRAVALRPDQPMALPHLVSAFVHPFVRCRRDMHGTHHALLLARAIARAGEEAEPALRAFADSLAMAFIAALTALNPGTSRDDAAWAYRFAMGALLHHLTDDHAPRTTDCTRCPAPACDAGRLVDFIVGGVRAMLLRPALAAPLFPRETALP